MADLSTRDGETVVIRTARRGRLGVALSWKTTQLTDFVVAFGTCSTRETQKRGRGRGWKVKRESVHSVGQLERRRKIRITRTRRGGGRGREKYWPRQAVSGLADIPAASRRPL